jgi:cohesin complex subunit SCC1
MDFEERAANPQNQNQHVARITDITLATGEDLHLNLGEPEFDFDLGLGDGIGSQDYELDLGIDFGDGPAANEGDKTKDTADGEGDETMSVEIGRDAMSHRSARESIGSHLLGKDNLDFDALSNRSKSRELSEHPMDIDFGADFGGMDIDLGLDFGETGDTTMGTALGAGEEPTEAQQQIQEQPPRSPSRACEQILLHPPV